MNWEAIGAIGELLGALAVLGSILYLASQVKAATRQMSIDTQSEVQRNVYDAYAPIYEGRNAEIFYNGLYSPEKLDAVDGMIFDLLMHRHSAAYSMAVRRFESGILDRAYRDYVHEHYREVLMQSEGAQSWAQAHPSSDFHRMLEQDVTARS